MEEVFFYVFEIPKDSEICLQFNMNIIKCRKDDIKSF